ncbi:hypothetical protein [Alloscardovia omnicolens]|uniref:hypothetical protein n=1 Tax=Alloscardovia omnicolens TaxID=419015 RepID=UPI00066831AE|nr:hypothetical protein [Alloscardovia omnicolens]KWZ75521.1 hypothetical protein HMPREF3214_00385 [Alloscardovia omnicolens]MDK6327356.1 hypothetical protein [Alloscardovia omnicolens]MDK8073816.1 hypothetical protein [Alloscardovia omnicolens]MDK8081788.1 hypothetical protein [Alloscardovia omnicolens]
MKALKNLSLGFYVGVLAFIVEVVALVFYFINQGTVTFGNLPLNMVTVVGGVIALAIQLLILVLGQLRASNKTGVGVLLDLAYVVEAVLIVWGATVFFADRINLFSSVMTFNRNAQSLADMNSALYGIGAMFAAAVLVILSSFMRVSKNQE